MTVPVPDRPTPALFDELADDQGLTFLSARRRAEALASFRAARPELDRLRALPMPFLDPVEPAVATQWIEQGGAA